MSDAVSQLCDQLLGLSHIHIVQMLAAALISSRIKLLELLRGQKHILRFDISLNVYWFLCRCCQPVTHIVCKFCGREIAYDQLPS
jgi:hypothetical protein